MSDLIHNILKGRRRQDRWRQFCTGLAFFTALITALTLMLPAVALNHRKKVLACAYTPHAHDDSCYVETLNEDGEVIERALICGMAAYAAHVHNDDCYDANGDLVCPLPEIEPHQHSDDCYETTLVLVCGQEERSGHTHTEACYTYEPAELLCGELEHVHSDACYESVLTCTEDHEHTEECFRRDLTCGFEEHTHTDDCWRWENVLTCGEVEGPGHTHSDACFTEEKTLTCEKPVVIPHIHNENCYETILDEEGNVLAVNRICGMEQVEVHVHGPECFVEVDMTPEEVAALGLQELPAAEEEEIIIAEETPTPQEECVVEEAPDEAISSEDEELVEEENISDQETIAAEEAPGEAASSEMEEPVEEENITDRVIIFAEEAPDETASSEDEELVAEENISDQETIVAEEAPDEAASSEMEEPVEEEDITDRVIIFAEEDLYETASAEEEELIAEENLAAEAPRPAQYFSAETGDISVTVEAPEGAFPQGTEMRVTEVEQEQILDAAAEAVAGEVVAMRAVDITFVDADGDEIEPAVPIKVTLLLLSEPELTDAMAEPVIVHVDDDGTAEVVERLDNLEEVMDMEGFAVDAVTSAEACPGTAADELVFEADSFSVYAIVYTVDFSYSVDGQVYEFSLPGGEEITLSDLMEVLGVLDGTNFESVSEYIGQVERVEFSDESLVKVIQTEGSWELESLQPFDTEEELTITMKNGDVVTVKVTDAQIKTYFISDSGELYEVTVTYGDDAQIPDGATLKVTEFSEGSKDYTDARKAVLADMLERGETIDLSSMGLAALDISILDADGNEIEPAAPVLVDMTIKALPGVDDLSEIADTLTVKHHVETEDGVVIEKVFGGAAEAEFDWNTDETVAADGVAVDPDAVDMSAFEFTSFDLYSDGSIVVNQPVEEDEIAVSFETPVFSTFTVTWSNSSTASSQLRISSLSNGKYILYARDAANGNYYALVPGTELSSVQVTLNGQLIQYSGSENLYWDVEVSRNTSYVSGYSYYFSFTENGTKYYLAAGQTQDHVIVRATKTNTGNANTTGWDYWSDYIFSAGDTFLQSYNGTFRTWNVAGVGDWGNSSLIYFEKEGATIGGNHATIHYVDTAGNELTVSNGQPVSDTNGGINYLIYDIDGYEYAYTYRNSVSNKITPALQYSGNRWKYTTGTDRDGNNSWNNLSDNDDIYVVYKKKTEPPTGGTPTPKVTGEKPDAPTITKSSTVNGDGTNTLALSVTGHTSNMEAEKLADVIVIYDVSGSMNYRMDSETNAVAGKRRMDYAQEATKALAKSLLGKNTTDHPGLIRMALISFSNSAQKVQDFTTDKETFDTAVDGLPSPEGGTNWEQALQMANEMAVSNDRATFVVFVTDGNPTFRMTRGTLHNDATNNGLGVSKAGNPYWSYDVGNYYYRYNVYGGGNNDEWGRNYAAALTVAQSIVDHNKNFYTIGISNDVTNLTKLTTEAGAGADHSKTATSEDELIAAFDDIAASIIALMGHSDIQITDGITDLTQTVQKSDLVSFAEDDFTYYKGHAATAEDVTSGKAAAEGEMVWESWDPTSEDCAEAEYKNGAVEWNMGETFMLEDGYTYQVRFKVWPSQDAYDLLADLNNGVKSYDSLSAEEKAQIKEPTTSGGKYTLKTNSETSYTYKEATKSGETVTPIGEPSEPGTFPDVDPLQLTTRPLKVQKQWHNNYVDSRALLDSITMELYGVNSDGSTERTFKTITLSQNSDWYSGENYVSYGLVTLNKVSNGTADETNVKIYETGHDFTLRETGEDAHYYELSAGTFRPMDINGTSTVLELVDQPAGMKGSAFYYSDGAHEYYRLDGKVYRDTQSDIIMIATNSHRSYMDLTKVVVDESGTAAVDDSEFEYQITFTVPEGIDNYDTMEKYIWFSVYDPNRPRNDGTGKNGVTLTPGTDYSYSGAQTPASIDSSTYGGSAYAGYLVATSGQQLTLKIKPSWNVRFLNLPIGTTYSFQEVNIAEGYTFVKAEVSGTRWIANMADGEDKGEAVTMTGLPANTSGNNSSTTITGAIDYANARYSTTYTNKTVTKEVNILKTAQDGNTPLAGAVFSLYTEKGYEADPKIPAKTGLTSGADGKIALGKLALGTYYLVETEAPAGYIPLSEPVEITVASTGVTYRQSNSSLSSSNNGVSYESDVYTLTVTNNAGYALPSTGGPGTRLFTILGSILILGAGALLWRKRRAV